MAFQNFPYTNLHELNTDAWLRKQKELETRQGELEQNVAKVDETIQTMVPTVVEQWLAQNFDSLMVNASYRESDETVVLAPTSEPPAVWAGKYVSQIQLINEAVKIRTSNFPVLNDLAGAEMGTIGVTSGRNTAGDGGSGSYYVTATPPISADGGRVVQLESGKYAVLLDRVATTAHYGIFDGDTKQAELQSLLSNNEHILMLPGTYYATAGLTVDHNADIEASGSIIKCTGAINGALLHLGREYLVNRYLKATGRSFNVGDNQVVSGEPGDVVVISSEQSFNTARASYTRGEMLVLSGNGAEAIYGCVDSYSNASVYLLPSCVINVRGLIIDAASADYALLLDCLVNSNLQDISVTNRRETTNSADAMSMRYCYNTQAMNCFVYMAGSVDGDIYGLSVASCQSVKVAGLHARGVRHGVTLGYYTLPGDTVVNRWCNFEGDFDSVTGYSADLHGNCEHCGYTGVAHNSISFGGQHNYFHGRIISRNRRAIHIEESLGNSYDFRGIKVEHRAENELAVYMDDPVGDSGGVLDFSGSSWRYFGSTFTKADGMIILRPGKGRNIVTFENSVFDGFVGTAIVQPGGGVGVTWYRLNAGGCVFNLPKFVTSEESGYISPNYN